MVVVVVVVVYCGAGIEAAILCTNHIAYPLEIAQLVEGGALAPAPFCIVGPYHEALLAVEAFCGELTHEGLVIDILGLLLAEELDALAHLSSMLLWQQPILEHQVLPGVLLNEGVVLLWGDVALEVLILVVVELEAVELHRRLTTILRAIVERHRVDKAKKHGILAIEVEHLSDIFTILAGVEGVGVGIVLPYAIVVGTLDALIVEVAVRLVPRSAGGLACLHEGVVLGHRHIVKHTATNPAASVGPAVGLAAVLLVDVHKALVAAKYALDESCYEEVVVDLALLLSDEV